MPSLSILGFNLSHDSSVCLVQDGRVTAALALERTTGVKRGVVPAHVYPAAMAQLTQSLLADSQLQPGDIAYWIATSTESRDQADEDRLSDTLGLLTTPERKLSLPHPGHHLAHASAAFYTSGLPEAAALVIDAYGSRSGTGRERESAFVFRRGERPELLWRATREEARIAGRERDGVLWIPGQLSGIGELYRVVTLALGFAERGSTYDDAGKTMGLAAYGRRFSSENLFMRAEGGRLSFEGAAEALIDLKLAVRRGEGLELIPRASDDPLTQFHHDLAAQIQSEFEEACLHLVEDVLTRTGIRHLVLSGGVSSTPCSTLASPANAMSTGCSCSRPRPTTAMPRDRRSTRTTCCSGRRPRTNQPRRNPPCGMCSLDRHVSMATATPSRRPRARGA